MSPLSKISNLFFLNSKIFFSTGFSSDENLKFLIFLGVIFKLETIVSKLISFEISASISSILLKNDWLNSSTPIKFLGLIIA